MMIKETKQQQYIDFENAVILQINENLFKKGYITEQKYNEVKKIIINM